MEDIPEISDWNQEEALQFIKKNPIDVKVLKNKLDRIYMITSYNQQEYLKDVIDAYTLMKLANDLESLNSFLETERLQKYFLEEFVHTAIRYMILCRKFKLKSMMVMTQKMMVQGLKLFIKFFDQLEKYPKMTIILRHTFDIQKQFFKLNYVNQYPYLIVPPTDAQVSEIDAFIDNLSAGDRVDVLKSEMHSKRLCWVPGTVKKITSISIYVICDNEKGTVSFDRRSMQVRPFQSMKKEYQWRMNLKADDQIDFLNNNHTWVHSKVLETRETQQEDDDQSVKCLEVCVRGSEDWLSITDPRIQKLDSTVLEGGFNTYTSNAVVDDFNDMIFDPEMKCTFVARPEATKSMLFLDLLHYAHNDLNLFNLILKKIQEKTIKIELVADLLSFVSVVSPLFHKKFATTYLNQLTESILDYINNSKESTIRNFSKQRFEAVYTSLNGFLKRLKPIIERRTIIQKFQLELILRFLFSDFLDKKLQAVVLLTQFFRYSKQNMTQKPLSEYLEWIKANKILPAIFSDKSHSELISRSADFLKYYLYTDPSAQELECLLIWNEAILKLASEYFEDLPEEIQEAIVNKIKERQNVTNIDALNIVKKTQDCEDWLLKNGGQCWVQVAKDKLKRNIEFEKVFEQPFKVVMKITKQVEDLYQCGLKTHYFKYLFESGYLVFVLKEKDLSFENKLQFASLTLSLLNKISDEIFEAILPFLVQANDNMIKKYQEFFISLQSKFHYKHIKQLFEVKFQSKQTLQEIGKFQFKIFQSCFILINEQSRNIDKKVKYELPSAHSFRRQKKQYIIIKKNPNELTGFEGLLHIVFQNKNIDVTMDAIKFIGFIFKHLADDLKGSIAQFERTFLENCLIQLYKVSTNAEQQSEQTLKNKQLLQKKYLKILQQIISQSQLKGTDQTPSLNSLFPEQKLHVKIIDYFNVNKSRVLMQVPSNLTLYEFKYQIGKIVNAHVHEMKIMLNNKEQLDDKYNGYVIHVLGLNDTELFIEKKVEIPRVNLTEADGRIVDKAKFALGKIFKEYSSFGMMSKKQCKKYHQKCAGQSSYSSDNTVDRIYDQYDKDNDGYLGLQDFLKFYEDSARSRESTVWDNLQIFGVRNDLQFLDDVEIQYAKKEELTKYLLFENEKFMKIMFSLLSSTNVELVKATWSLLARLPLYKDFNIEPNPEKQYEIRYWLYVIKERDQSQKLTKQLLKVILKTMGTQTICIALNVAQLSNQIDEQIFKIVFQKLNQINSKETLSFHNKVILDNGLKILERCLEDKDEKVKVHYLQQKNQEHYNKILRNGIMSANLASRTMYCNSIEDIINYSVDNDFEIFQALFNLIYRIFDKCDKSTLTIQYFDLFTSLLEILRQHEQLMEKLKINWPILTQEMISLYKSHECTETSINSKPDQVAQGFLRIITKLLNNQTIKEIVELVPYIFQSSLFPENGKNKLKNSKSRQDAYDLIYQICRFKGEKGEAAGLQKLFGAGFKKIYKKMSTKKSYESFSYYYYNYNEARSQLGYAGIRNLGCICYMISVLQQLYMTGPFRNLVLMADDGEPECLVKRNTKQIDDNIYHQFRNLFAHLLLTQKQEFNPDDFCFSFKDFEGQPINVSVQQDAQQFVNLFFDKIETSLKNTPFRNILENVYGGQSCSQMICSGCGATKQRFENFYPFSLEIKGYKNVYQSFQKYIEGQIIQEYQCDSCNNKCDVTKKNFLSRTPNYFIVHLQRMCFNYDKFENQKVNSRCEFPQELNVYDYTISKQKNIPENNDEFTYKLRGVVLHYGTADFGHYFSYIKQSDNLWLEFNDQRVRQLDPNDIELQCFGGEHWRRESQNAYLLVYEREKKSDLIMSFKDEAEKEQYFKQFKLEHAIVDKQKQQMTEEAMQEIKESKQEEKDEKQKDEKDKQEKTQKEQKRIQVRLDMSKIAPFVPKPIKQKIQKENDEFSFTMNLSNEEFAQFIYHILSIDPPEELKSEFLELCYESFHLKQMVCDEEDKSISIAEWASKRFKQLINGHGLEFLKNFGKNWDSDLLSIEKSTRSVTKSLLDCVITDIIQSINLDYSNQRPDDQTLIVMEFIDKLSDMMLNEVAKHWQRLKEYFELWIGLVRENKLVRFYCQKNMFIDKILDFIMENQYPHPRTQKRYPMGTQYYSPEFQHPLELMQLLLVLGYQLCEKEEKCFRAYAFMDKVINFRFEGGSSMIPTICKGNRIISQKMAFLLLNGATKVSHSDQAKPIIASIHQFLNIDDQLKNQRFGWIIGFPIYIEHEKTSSYGSYGIYPDSDAAVSFISAVGSVSILELIVKNKNKTPHSPALFISMVLQLQKEGFMNNLDEFPSYNSFEECYSSWIGKFVSNYFEEINRPYTYHSYIEYSNRLKKLWEERPNRPLKNAFPRYIIGKTIESNKIAEQNFYKVIDVTQYNVKSHYMPHNPELSKANFKLLKKCKTASNFISSNLPEKTTAYGYSRINNYMKLQSSEQEDQEEKNPNDALFENTMEGFLLRKVIIANNSSENFLIVIHSKAGENCNLHLPSTPVRLELKSETVCNFTLIKKDVEKDYGEMQFKIQVLGKATKSGYWPRQILTKIEEKVDDDQGNSGQEDSSETWN